MRLEWNNKAQREEKGLSLRLRARPVRPPSRRLARAIRFLLAFPGTPCCMSLSSLCDFGARGCAFT